MREPGKAKGRKGMTLISPKRGKTYEQIRQQALRITKALGAQVRGNAPEPHPDETNFWAGYGTPRGRQVAMIAGRYLENARDYTGLPLEHDNDDKRANTKIPRSVYMRRNRNWE